MALFRFMVCVYTRARYVNVDLSLVVFNSSGFFDERKVSKEFFLE